MRVARHMHADSPLCYALCTLVLGRSPYSAADADALGRGLPLAMHAERLWVVRRCC